MGKANTWAEIRFISSSARKYLFVLIVVVVVVVVTGEGGAPGYLS
jgi:hypothetical protein